MSRDLRKYSKRTNQGLVIGFIILLFGVGITLIGLIYGPTAAMAGIVCLLAGISPVFLIWVALAVLRWIVVRSSDAEPED